MKYDNKHYWTFNFNEFATKDHLIMLLTENGNFPEDVNATSTDASDVSSLIKELSNIENRSQEINDIIIYANKYFKTQGDAEYDVYSNLCEFLHGLIPEFLYFNEYSLIPGRVSIDDMIEKQKGARAIRDEDKAVLALINLAEIDLEALSNADYEFTNLHLKRSSKNLIESLLSLWTQNENIEFEFGNHPANSKHTPPFNTGNILHLSIKNLETGYSLPLEEQSHGMRWYLSFQAYFSQFQQEEKNVVLLLDEPGLHLHGQAQQDFLKSITQRFAKYHQIIYTTHSPFMIDPTNLQRVFTVEKDNKNGTNICSDVLSKDPKTLFPLQGALGYDVVQSMFIGPNCLIVEGTSDYVYLEQMILILDELNRTVLKRDIAISPAGGASIIAFYATLLWANKLNVVMLLDSTPKEKRTVAKWEKENKFGHLKIIFCEEFVENNYVCRY